MSKRYKNYNGNKNRNRQDENVVADVQGVVIDDEEVLEEEEQVEETEEDDEEDEVEETKPRRQKKSKKKARRREEEDDEEDEGIITPKGKKILLGILFSGLAIGGGIVASKVSHDRGRKKGFSEGYAAGYTDGKPKPIEQQPIDTMGKFVNEEEVEAE